MLYKVLHAIIIMGTRHEIGEIVDVNDDIAKPLDRRDIIPLVDFVPEPIKDERVTLPTNLEKLPKDELVKFCKKLGLSSEGRKSDLIERLELSK